MTHTLLTVSPHPDDETIGAGAVISHLTAHGWDVINLACSMGHEEDHLRRRNELTNAATRLGFTTVEMNPLARIGRDDSLRHAAEDVADAVTSMLETYAPDIVASPHLADAHHGHEAVAAGVQKALQQTTNGPRWWQYGIWNDLPKPTIYIPFDHDTLADISYALDAYQGENDRSHYDQMYPARAVVARTLGSERVFGFGTATSSNLPYADLLTEMRHSATGWQIANPRTLNPATPLADTTWNSTEVFWLPHTTVLREHDLRRRVG